LVATSAEWRLFQQISGSSFIDFLDLLAYDHHHILLDLNHIIWLISRVKNSASIAVWLPTCHSLLLKVLLEILQERVFINNLREVADLPLVVVESDTKSGNITVTFKALPVFDNFIMGAGIFRIHVGCGDSSFHPCIDIVLIGIERPYVADEGHGLRDQPCISLVGNFLN
jgi:hypothetical protein